MLPAIVYAFIFIIAFICGAGIYIFAAAADVEKRQNTVLNKILALIFGAVTAIAWTIIIHTIAKLAK